MDVYSFFRRKRLKSFLTQLLVGYFRLHLTRNNWIATVNHKFGHTDVNHKPSPQLCVPYIHSANSKTCVENWSQSDLRALWREWAKAKTPPLGEPQSLLLHVRSETAQLTSWYPSPALPAQRGCLEPAELTASTCREGNVVMELPISKPAFLLALESCSQGVLLCGCSKESQLREVSFVTQLHWSFCMLLAARALPLPPSWHLLAGHRTSADLEIRSYR